MTATTFSRPVLARRASQGNYRIRLKISPADREDAWDLFRVALQCGGVEVQDCCFAFATEERWLTALESLRFRFGSEYFEAIEAAETRDE